MHYRDNHKRQKSENDGFLLLQQRCAVGDSSRGLLFCIVGMSVDKNWIGSAQPPRFHVLSVRKGEKNHRVGGDNAKEKK